MQACLWHDSISVGMFLTFFVFQGLDKMVVTCWFYKTKKIMLDGKYVKTRVLLNVF